MKVNFYDLNGRYECDRRRQHEYEIKEAETQIVLSARMQKEILCDAVNGVIPVDEIEQSVKQAMEDIPYKSRIGKDLMEKDISRRLKRAAEDLIGHVKGIDHWKIVTQLPEVSINISVGKEPVIVCGVKPDMVVTYSNNGILNINAYLIRIGRPIKKNGTCFHEKDIKTDKQLYTLLQYSKQLAGQLAKPDEKVTVSSGYMFLRKKTDRNATILDPEEHFDNLLFYDDKGKATDNIITIKEDIIIDSLSTATAIDSEFTEPFNCFIDGLAPDKCTEEQCINCELNELCHYTHPPVQIATSPSSVSKPGLIILSKIQEKIELFNSGYAVVNAVPGAGKTLVLVLRIIELMNCGVKPEEIAIITFTNSGAEVFRQRIALYNDELGNGDPVDGMTATTFNGLGQKILEKEYSSLGFSKPPRVIDPVERSGIIASLLDSHYIPGLDYMNFTTDMKNYKGALAVASSCFQAMKQYGWTIFDADKISSKIGRYCSRETAEALAELFDEYCSFLKERALVEYADQEVIILEMLQKNPYYFDSYGWKHILVDESQDTSENQFRLLKYMTQTSSFESCMVVGDDAQSIYGFRDTSPKFFMDFEDTMGLKKSSVNCYYMTDNFRSTPEIVDFANKLIEINKWKITKEIVSKSPSGKPVTVKGFMESQEEYDWIVKQIKDKIDSGIPPESISFIASTRTELIKMADLLTMENIPSIILVPERYFENPRVRAAIALAKFFQNTADNKDCLIYINARLGGDTFILTDEQVKEYLVKMQNDAENMKSLPEESFRKEYFNLLDQIDEEDEIYQSFIKTLSNQPSMLAVFSYCNDFEIYGERAEKRRDNSYPGVVLTTAHSSKGMEWPIVFNSLSKYDLKEIHTGKEIEQVEERRRLLFVSATRAKEELFITGKYIAYGGMKTPHYNQFLLEAYEITGSEPDIPFEM